MKHVPLGDDLRSQLDASDTHRPLEVWLSVPDADLLRERVGEVLQVKGFDEHYATTPLGEVLEGLIDKLFTG